MNQPINIRVPSSLLHKLEQTKLNLRIHTGTNISRTELVTALLEYGLEHYELTDIVENVRRIRSPEEVERCLTHIDPENV